MPPNRSQRPETREESAPALRFVREHVENNRDEEDEPLHCPDPRAGQARGDQARLDHADDEAAEHRPDDVAWPPKIDVPPISTEAIAVNR